ncbi:protein AE7-like 1 [Diaphorina citri]|uniref:Protein AE7-like 1 n=1 Tax=Diaphorina citri TaxID=121845 RepID=A0A3Q0IPB8_DIACI|nr:protein AE7-like 1 [Diaphorina citri]
MIISSINTLSKPVVPELLSGDPEYEAKKQELRETIYDCIKNIKDPEKPATLEDLNVVYEEGVKVIFHFFYPDIKPNQMNIPTLY